MAFETLTVHDTGTPFTVTGPAGDINAEGGNTLDVTWNVAGTDLTPISATTVDVYLTQDNGITWTQIAANETNDGAATVTLPATADTGGAPSARLMVRGTGSAFFNVSPTAFEIVPAGTQEFRVVSNDDNIFTCSGSTVSGSLFTVERGSFSETITFDAVDLPPGAVSDLPKTAAVGQTVTYNIDLSGVTSDAPAAVKLVGTSASFTHQDTVTVGQPRDPSVPEQNGNLDRAYYFPDLDEAQDAFTLEFWFQPYRVDNLFNRIKWGNFFMDIRRYGPSDFAPSGYMRATMGGSAVTSDTIYRNQWSHVAVVLENDMLKMYTNGKLSGEVAANPSDDFSDGFRFGTPEAWYTRVFGRFDQVRLWTRALGQDEIRQNLHLPRSLNNVCNDNLEISLEYSNNGHQDAAAKYLMETLSGSETVVVSTGPIGSGVADRQTVNSVGTTNFSNSVSIDFGTAPGGEILVTRLDGAPHGTAPTSDPLMSDYWVIRNYGTTQTGLNATVTFTEPGFVQTTDPAFYHLYKRGSNDREDWENPIPAASVDAATGAVTFSGIDRFSQFAIARSDMALVLPIDLLAFSARYDGDKAVLLNWETAEEQNNAGFSVERSTDGHNFTAVGWVAGRNEAAGYTFTDSDLPAGVSTLYYRLRQQDTDDKYAYSAVVSVELTHNGLIGTLAPNPTTGILYLTTNAVAPDTPIEVHDLTGRLVRTFVLGEQSPRTLNVADLEAGIYLLRVGTQTHRFVKR